MTYSIVARDPGSGTLGVACQSHFFAVAGAVNWAEAGVGAVATQSFVEPAYGYRGLQLIREGASAQLALDMVLADDPHPELRQVALVSARGEIAVHNGERCVGFQGSRTGAHYSVQGNMLTGAAVLDAMASAMEGDGPLVERMLAALRAAETAGGELRGRQAAGIKLVADQPGPVPWAGTLVDLRVEDSADPIAELTRLVRQHELASVVVGSLFTEGVLFGDAHGLPAGHLEATIEQLADVARQRGEVGLEAALWHSVLLARAGRADEAAETARAVAAHRPSLAAMLANLAEAGYLSTTHLAGVPA